MSSLMQPRGKLPAQVYWFRRGLVLATALALVFGIAHLLGGSSGPGEPREQASIVAARPSTTPQAPAKAGPVVVTPPAPTATARKKARNGQQTVPPPATTPAAPLVAPTGPCTLDSITVTPVIRSVAAGSRIMIPLQLTGTQPACTFKLSSRTVVVKVVSGKDRIWSTQQCKAAIGARDVVVRSAVPALVLIPWSARRSDDSCSTTTRWAMPGFYHAVASVIGSEPTDTQFRLTEPERPTVVRTIEPKPKKQG